MRKPLLPCIVCHKKMEYLWPDEETSNIDDGCDVIIIGSYGSKFDMDEYHAIICDKCLEAAYTNSRARFVKEHAPF